MTTTDTSTRLRRVSRRLLAASAAALLATGIAVTVPADAAPGPVVSRSSSGVTADALPTAQIDGVAWTQVVSGNRVYVGGSFTTARPAGAAPGVDTVPRNNLMAYDITTGAIVDSFAPSLNGQVKALAVSPDGSRLYVGGDFTSANGQNRYRVAAFDTATGALLNDFVVGTDTTVNAIVATSTTVYIGGAFSNANNTPRARLAAFRASDGAVLGWAPTADNNSVESMVLTPDGSKLIVGGSFTTINGSSSGYGMGALDPTTGSLLPWAAGNTIKNAGTAAAILNLSTDGTAIYGTGYVFGAGGNLEGAFSADPSTGAINWIEDCHGDTYGAYGSGSAVYVVGHPHDCTRTGDFPQTDPWTFQYALAWTPKATGTLLTNQVSGYGDFGGQPSPGMVNWFPQLSEGSYTKQYQAAWTVAGNANYVVLGGEFPTVNGTAQQGLVRFAVPSIAPDKQGPQLSGYFYRTTQTALSATSVRVTWPANWDRDDQTLTYDLIRDGDDNHPVYTTTANSQYWNRPTLSFVDSTVQPDTTYNYYVRVTDGDGNSARGDYTTITTPSAAAPASAYATAVLNDGPVNYWRFGDPAGSTTATDSAGSATLTEQPGVVEGSAGAINGDSDTAAAFSGTSTGTSSTSTLINGPTVFSLETWIKTTTTSGGKIIGFGSSSSGTSGRYDRHIYMDNSGRLIFGTYDGSVHTLTTPDRYNDGAWHHVVATLSSSGAAFYVDGKTVGTGSFTTAEPGTGYWRVGGDNLNNWPNTPSSPWFKGTIDDTAVYTKALTSTQVRDHYTASGRTAPSGIAPTAKFTSSCSNVTCSFDGSGSTAASGATISSYSWSYGDGATGTGTTASRTYAKPGTYTVKLTVTDNFGLSSSTTATVSPTTTPPKAAFTVSCSGRTCYFDGTSSAATVPNASITKYAWRFGDGATSTSSKPVRTYGFNGTFTVTLTVTDSFGVTATASKSVTVRR